MNSFAKYVGRPGGAVAVAVGVLTVVMTALTVVLAINLTRLSDINAALQTTSTRIDAIYPQITEQANNSAAIARDVGTISGDLRLFSVSASESAASLKDLVPRFERAVVDLEAQQKSLDSLNESVSELTKAARRIEQRFGAVESPNPFDQAANMAAVQTLDELLAAQGYKVVLASGESPELRSLVDGQRIWVVSNFDEVATEAGKFGVPILAADGDRYIPLSGLDDDERTMILSTIKSTVETTITPE